MCTLAVEMLLGSCYINNIADMSLIYLIAAILFLIGFIIYETLSKLKLIVIMLSILSLLASFFIGFVRSNDYLEAKEYIEQIEDGESITFYGRLTLIEAKPSSYYLYFDNIIIDDVELEPHISIILISDSDEYSLGTKAQIEGKKVQFNRARNEGNFDEKDYYNSLGCICKVKGSIQEFSLPVFSLQEYLYELRCDITKVLDDNLPGEESGIMSAMCLGDKSGLDTDTKDLFKLSGLAHILAISGLHISIIGMGIYKPLRRRGLNFVVSGIISSALVILYGMLVDGGVSTIRAIGMFLIMIIANIIGHSYDVLTGLAVTMMYLIVLYPYCVLSAGFVFSFGAVFGIAIVVSPLTSIYEKFIRLRFLERHKGEAFRMSIKERIIKALLSGALIQLVTLPIVCYYYYEIPTYVVLINLVIIPLLGVLLSMTLIGGLIGVIASCLVVLSGLLSVICETFLYISHIILYAYELLAYNSLQLPLARIVTGRPTVIEIVLYYLILYMITRCFIIKARNIDKFIKSDYVHLRHRVVAVIIGFVALILVITNNDNRLAFEIDMLDVGQGDGIYIGGGDVNYFIDGGSTDVKNVGKYRILPWLKFKGIRSIEYWFVSHTDSDHMSGLAEALDAGYPIDYIVVDSYMIGESNYDEIKTKADKNNTQILVMNVGDEISTDDFTLRCIFAGDESIDDINANSLVLLGEYGSEAPVKLLTGGDMTSATEKLILSDVSNDVLDVDILKCAHHGSKTSSSKDFVDALSPDVALISAGVNNRYGHPHGVTLDTLEDAGCDIYRTDIGGRVQVDLESKEVYVWLDS